MVNILQLYILTIAIQTNYNGGCMEYQNIGKEAKAKGIYRCTGDGETAFLKSGEKFPECSCNPPGQWELLKSDNRNDDDTIPLFVTVGYILLIIATDQLPEIDQALNLRSIGEDIETGRYKITNIQEEYEFFFGELIEGIEIQVERVGGLLDDLPIHETVFAFDFEALV